MHHGILFDRRLRKQLMMSLAMKRKKQSQFLNSPPPKLKHTFKNQKRKADDVSSGEKEEKESARKQPSTKT